MLRGKDRQSSAVINQYCCGAGSLLQHNELQWTITSADGSSARGCTQWLHANMELHSGREVSRTQLALEAKTSSALGVPRLLPPPNLVEGSNDVDSVTSCPPQTFPGSPLSQGRRAGGSAPPRKGWSGRTTAHCISHNDALSFNPRQRSKEVAPMMQPMGIPLYDTFFFPIFEQLRTAEYGHPKMRSALEILWLARSPRSHVYCCCQAP